jgi:hypothetical protein
MDKLLKECFFRALNLVAETAKLPLLTSTFYSAFMLPQCPTGMRLDVKKSSYKKVINWLWCRLMSVVMSHNSVYQ